MTGEWGITAAERKDSSATVVLGPSDKKIQNVQGESCILCQGLIGKKSRTPPF